MKTLHQLEKESLRVQESSKELEMRANQQEERLKEAKLRMQKIEDEEREKCKKTSAILKEFQKKTGNGPFFETLLDILLNFQGFINHFMVIRKTFFQIFISFFSGGINSIRRTVKCLAETLSQLVDAVRTVQEDQSKMSMIIDRLATKVNFFNYFLYVAVYFAYFPAE